MAPPALQLFPPPAPEQRKPVQQWPSRTTSRAAGTNPFRKVAVPEPIAERRQNGKSPVDFHELVIRVSSPSSPAAPVLISGVEAPKQAHIAKPRTPPQQNTATFLPPPPPRAPSNSAAPGTKRPRVFTPTPSAAQALPGTAVSPEGRVAISPTSNPFASPVSKATATPIDSAISLVSPPRQRVASPTMSDPRSGSPTLVRSNSGATARSPASPPPMRSMFPRYNPSVPLDQQAYKPTQSSPTHIPMSKISRPLYSPNEYTPYSSMEYEGPEQAPKATPYYTPSSMLDSLWDATNGQGTPVVQTFTLQMHRHPASRDQVNEPQISFGPSPSLPFYTLSHTDIPPGPGEEDEDGDDDEHELLIRRHHPTKPTNVPISHLRLSPTPSGSTTGAAKNVDPASLITTIYPKIAALTALDIASQSPAACHIAAFDPDATSAAAQRLAEDVLKGTAERECCALVWTRGQANLTPQYSTTTAGSYALHHPTLGMFPVLHEGDTSPGLSPVLGRLPFSQRNPTPIKRGNNKPTTITILAPSPPESPSPSSTVLAKLDFATDSLTLHTSHILAHANTYLTDVLVSTLLAVALAEEKRLRSATRFAAPPTGPGMPYSFSTAPGLSALEESRVKRKRLFKFMRTKTGVKEIPTHLYKSTPTKKTSGEEQGVELRDLDQRGGGSLVGLPFYNAPGEAVGKGKKGAKSEVPFVVRTVVTVLGWGFKSVVWVIGVSIKIVAGVVVRVSTFVVARAKA